MTGKEIKINKLFSEGKNAVIVAVGHIKKDVLKEKLEKAFGKWQKGEIKEQKVANALQVSKRVVYLVDKPGAAQSVISIGRIGVARSTTDYFPITIMNTILGGSFSSRLNQNLREKNGYTYGARSGFSFRESAGPFTASASVQTEVTDKALTEFFNELNGISQPIPAEDITRGKNYVALSYPGNFQAVQEIAGQLSEMVQFNLPESYFNDYVSNMLNVSGDAVQNAAKKYIVTDQMAIIVVGDKTKVEEGIKKLNLGEVINLTIEDVLGKVPKLDN
jgi:predicted Zn-dependent peptidase